MRTAWKKFIAGPVAKREYAQLVPSTLIPAENAFQNTFLIQNADKASCDAEALAIIKQALQLHEDDVPDEIHYKNLRVEHTGLIPDINSMSRYDRDVFECENVKALLPILDEFLGVVPLLEITSLVDTEELYLRCTPEQIMYNGSRYAKGPVRIMLGSLVDIVAHFYPVQVRVTSLKAQPVVKLSPYFHSYKDERHTYSFNEGSVPISRFSEWVRNYSMLHVHLASAKNSALKLVYHRKDDTTVTLEVVSAKEDAIKGYTRQRSRMFPVDHLLPE